MGPRRRIIFILKPEPEVQMSRQRPPFGILLSENISAADWNTYTKFCM